MLSNKKKQSKSPAKMFVTCSIPEHTRIEIIKSSHKSRKTKPYKCHKCSTQIQYEDIYYSETSNIERLHKKDNTEYDFNVEIYESTPKKILCIECAKKNGKILSNDHLVQ